MTIQEKILETNQRILNRKYEVRYNFEGVDACINDLTFIEAKEALKLLENNKPHMYAM